MSAAFGVVLLVGGFAALSLLIYNDEKASGILDDAVWDAAAKAVPTKGAPTVSMTFDRREGAYVVATRHPSGCIVVQVASPETVQRVLAAEAEAIVGGAA